MADAKFRARESNVQSRGITDVTIVPKLQNIPSVSDAACSIGLNVLKHCVFVKHVASQRVLTLAVQNNKVR